MSLPSIFTALFLFIFLPACLAAMFLILREQRKMLRQLRHTMLIFFPAAKSWEVDPVGPRTEGSKITIKAPWDEEKEPIA